MVAFKGFKLICQTPCAEEKKDDAQAGGHPAGHRHPRQGAGGASGAHREPTTSPGRIDLRRRGVLSEPAPGGDLPRSSQLRAALLPWGPPASPSSTTHPDEDRR
jgi:hypothetical protein